MIKNPEGSTSGPEDQGGDRYERMQREIDAMKANLDEMKDQLDLIEKRLVEIASFAGKTAVNSVLNTPVKSPESGQPTEGETPISLEDVSDTDNEQEDEPKVPWHTRIKDWFINLRSRKNSDEETEDEPDEDDAQKTEVVGDDVDDTGDDKETKKGLLPRAAKRAAAAALAIAMALGISSAMSSDSKVENTKESTTSQTVDGSNTEDHGKNNKDLSSEAQSVQKEVDDVNQMLEDKQNDDNSALADGMVSRLDAADKAADQIKDEAEREQVKSNIAKVRTEAEDHRDQIKANALGTNLEDYRSIHKAAEYMGISDDIVKKLADGYGQPYSTLLSDNAEQYLQDNLEQQGNVGDAFVDSENNPDMVKYNMVYLAAQHDDVLAMYAGAIDEAKANSSSTIYGFITPQDNVVKLSHDLKGNKELQQQKFNEIRDILLQSNVQINGFNAANVYSYGDINNDNGLTVTESDTHTGHLIKLANINGVGDGKYIAVSPHCDQLLAGYAVYVPTVETTYASQSSNVTYRTTTHTTTNSTYTPPTTPPTTPPATPPTTPPTTPSKNPSEDANVNSGNHNQTDNAPATNSPVQKEPGQSNTNNSYVKPNGDVGQDGNTGSTEISKPSDSNGNISGNNSSKDPSTGTETRPGETDW